MKSALGTRGRKLPRNTLVALYNLEPVLFEQLVDVFGLQRAGIIVLGVHQGRES